MGLGFFSRLRLKGSLLVVVVVLAVDDVELMSLPVLLSGLSSEDLFVGDHLLVMVLQVLVGHNIVVLEVLVHILLDFFLVLFALWALVGGVEVVLLQVVVTDDVVVHQRVSLRSEVPGLFLRVVRPGFKATELVLEVDHVESLLVPQSTVLVLGEDVDEIVVFSLASLALLTLVGIRLDDGVVPGLLSLDGFVGDLDVRVCLSLEVSFSVDVGLHVLLPVFVVVVAREEDFVGSRLGHFLILGGEEGHF
mmetsp:Transcript_35585/g.54400  ORF Transcript_35585/g.54400 Transcript_35585/m.54400 type:complete len:249 (-) Transcript_35585:8-754(-)